MPSPARSGCIVIGHATLQPSLQRRFGFVSENHIEPRPYEPRPASSFAKAAFHSSIRFSSRPVLRCENVRGARSVAVRGSSVTALEGAGRVRVVGRSGVDSASVVDCRCCVLMSVGCGRSSKSVLVVGDKFRLLRVRPTSVPTPTEPTVIKVHDRSSLCEQLYENKYHGMYSHNLSRPPTRSNRGSTLVSGRISPIA